MDKLLSVLKYLLLLAIAAGLLVFAFKGISLAKVLSEVLKANFFWAAISLAFSIAAIISRSYRWNLLIESTGYKSPLKKTVSALMIGYLANLALPRLGEVTRCGSLSKAENIPFTNLLGTVIVERIIDLLTLLACLLLTALVEYRRLGNFLHDNIVQPAVDKFMRLIHSPIFVVGCIALLLVLLVSITRYVQRSNKRETQSRFGRIWVELVNGLRSIANLRRPWLFLFHSILIWVLYFFGVYTCFFALPATAHLGFSAALFLLAAGSLGMSAPVQGGIGAYHLLVSQGLMLYGLSREDGLAFATLVHTLQLLLIVVLGIVSLLLLFSNNRKVQPTTAN